MNMVEKQVCEAMKKSRDEALQEHENRNKNNERDVFVTTYHPALSQKVIKILKDNHNILSLGEDHKEVFPDIPMVSFRRTKSLKDILVRAMVKTQSSEPNECQGCNGRSDCEVCGILVKSSQFSNMDRSRTFDIRKGTLHCNTDKAIYLMTCNYCQKQYVGKSYPKFRSRYNNYKAKFRKYYGAALNGTLKNFKKPIPQAHLYKHFTEHVGENFIKDGKEDFSFWSFQIIDTSFNKEKLLERENFWIYKLKTMVPAGLNVREVTVEK